MHYWIKAKLHNDEKTKTYLLGDATIISLDIAAFTIKQFEGQEISILEYKELEVTEDLILDAKEIEIEAIEEDYEELERENYDLKNEVNELRKKLKAKEKKDRLKAEVEFVMNMGDRLNER